MIRRLLKAVRKMPRPPRSPGYRPLTKSWEGANRGVCPAPLARAGGAGTTARASHGPGRKARREEPGRSLSLYVSILPRDASGQCLGVGALPKWE